MKKNNYLLFSQENDIVIQYFDCFDLVEIKKVIIDYLTKNPDDTVELCKVPTGNDIRKFYGYEILSYYSVNKKNNEELLRYYILLLVYNKQVKILIRFAT